MLTRKLPLGRVFYPPYKFFFSAWAASAPVLYFHDAGVALDGFSHVTAQTFVYSGCSFNAIVNGFKAIQNLAQTCNFKLFFYILKILAQGRQKLGQIFHLAPQSQLTQPDQAWDIIDLINTAFDYMAMTDYPYPSNFLEPMPGWPIEVRREISEQKFIFLYEVSLCLGSL